MRIARLLGLLAAVLAAGILVAPAAAAQPPFRLSTYVVDQAGALTDVQRAQVTSALDKLYNDRKIRLWVVYVDTFSGQNPVSWARKTMGLSDFGSFDALLAIAIQDRAYALEVPPSVGGVTAQQVNDLRRNQIEPALHNNDWAGAAVAAADGLDTTTSGKGRGLATSSLLIALGIVAVGVLSLALWSHRRRRRQRGAEIAAARRVDPTDPEALASVSLEALDELSKSMVVEVDNAVRTSSNELALAVEEFGDARTEPFIRAVGNAKTTLAQAFNVRQQLDDAIPETPAQRRELLTRVVVAAARADRELEAQTEAFHKLRDLVINAPARLDTLTQQLVEVSARVAPSQQKLSELHTEFDDAALASVAGNVTAAQERITFADKSIGRARELASHPVAGEQAELVDSVRAAEAALGQARALLDAVDHAAGDIRHAATTLPSLITDIQAGITRADSLQAQQNRPQLRAARDAAATAVAAAQSTGNSDPLGAFTQLTNADAELDRLVAEIAQEQETTQRLSRSFDQALFTAQSRVRAVSDYIDTRRGSVGPDARTRLAEATRQVAAAQTTRSTNLNDAIAHANAASTLAAQAQAMANADVQAAQRAYTGRYGGGGNMGAMIGGLVIGNILGGALGGGGWGSTGFGGSGGASGGGYMGGGGRF